MLNDHVNLSLLQKSKLLMHVLKIIITTVTIQFYGSPIFFPSYLQHDVALSLPTLIFPLTRRIDKLSAARPYEPEVSA